MMKRSSGTVLLTLIGLSLLAIILTGCTSPGGGAQEKTAKMGEAVTVGSLKYTATAVNRVSEVGREGNINTARGKYVVVDMVIENKAKTKAEFDGDMAKLWDENDQAYELELEASAAACSASGIADVANVWFGSIETETAVKSKAVFDVPSDVKNLRMEVRSAEIGSDERAFITLGI